MQLANMLAELRQAIGLRQKADIQSVAQWLSEGYPVSYPNGDDTAAIRTATGYDLYAIEGFLQTFVEQDPWFAGWCGIMVNLSDIAAMGGRASAVVNALWASASDDKAEKIIQGMVAASHTYQVPIVGGHTNLQSEKPQLAVSVLGKAQRLLSAFAAEPGQALVVAIDLRGSYRAPFLNWCAALEAPAERLRGDLALLPEIAEKQLAIAAKDISQAGLLGTCLMLLESAQLGANIDLTAIPKPEAVSWSDWLKSFPSFGFLLSTPLEKLEDLLRCFHERDIAAAKIGYLTDEMCCLVNYHDQHEIFWDIQHQLLTGLSASLDAKRAIQTQP